MAATGTYTLVVSHPATHCSQCCYDGAAWVDCYVTTNAYPFDDNSSNTKVQWIGNDNTTFFDGASGPGSDKNGRANFSAITASPSDYTANSAVGVCKALGDGWYLPAYEELYAMSAGSADSRSNNLNGARILVNSGYHWSSSECYGNGGRHTCGTCCYSSPGPDVYAVTRSSAGFSNQSKKQEALTVHCAWRP
jgi:hypothetical protein